MTSDQRHLGAGLADVLALPNDLLPSARLGLACERIDARVQLSHNLSGADGKVRLGLGGRPQIFLDARLHDTEQRFVCAHEIAHALLDRPNLYSHLVAYGLNTADACEESLCDEVALHILLSRHRIQQYLDINDLGALVLAAEHLGVTVSTLVRRIVAERQQPLPLLLARRTANQWFATRLVGLTYAKQLSPSFELDARQLDGLSDERRTVSVGVEVAGRRVDAEAEATRHGTGAMLLFARGVHDQTSDIFI